MSSAKNTFYAIWLDQVAFAASLVAMAVLTARKALVPARLQVKITTNYQG